MLKAEEANLGRSTISIERVSSPDHDLSWAIAKPLAYNQITATPVPFVQVSPDGVDEYQIRGGDQIPHKNHTCGLENLPHGEYFVAQFVVAGELGKWMISHKILGEGGHVQARFSQLLFSDRPDVGVARVSHNVAQNKFLVAEKAVLHNLSDRPEVAKLIDSATIADGRRVNISCFFDLEDSHFIPKDWHFVQVDDLSPANLLRLVRLEEYARKKWAERGVHFVDWQDEEPVLFQNGLEHTTGSVLRSFLAMDFSSEIISDTIDDKLSSELNFYHLRVLPLLSRVFATNPLFRLSTMDMLKPIQGNAGRNLNANLGAIQGVFDPSDQIVTSYSDLISHWENPQYCIDMLAAQVESSLDRVGSEMRQANEIKDAKILEIQ